MNYNHIINKFHGKKLLVTGDLVLDQYIKGSVSRISPEAPVPIVLQEESFYTPGGAANVACNLSSLGAQVTLIGKIGDDIEGAILQKELEKKKIKTSGLCVDPRIHTIFKTRIIAHNQQVVRVDREKIVDFGDDAINRRIIGFILKNIRKFDGIIISDYGKGLINETLVSIICSNALRQKIPVVVDPKVEHFEFYGKVTSITPNKKETEYALRNMDAGRRKALGMDSWQLNTWADIEKAGQGLVQYLDIESLLITLGEQGMCLFEQGKKPFQIPTRAREVFDVSGAGDTVIAVFALGLAAGADKRHAADLANYAAGVVVGKMGAVAVDLEELKQAVKVP